MALSSLMMVVAYTETCRNVRVALLCKYGLLYKHVHNVGLNC